MTKVVHCKKESYDVYIGRSTDPVKGKWGNPFSHKKGTTAKYFCETRDESIDKHKEWITEGDGQYLLKDLHELEGKTLGCWCKPKRCHGDTLKELVEKKKSLF